MICPNKNHPEYKALVNKVGPTRALAVWDSTKLDVSTPYNNIATTVLDKISEGVLNHEQFLRASLPNFVKANNANTTDSFVRALYERVKKFEGGTISNGVITHKLGTTSLFPTAEINPGVKNSHTTKSDIIHYLTKLRDKFGIDFEIINDKTQNWKGKYLNDGVTKRVVINLANSTLDTPFHEYYHPFVRLLKIENETLYNLLAEKAPKDPNKEEEESVVEFLGREIQSSQPTNLLTKFIDWLRGRFLRVFPKSNTRIDQLTTISDVMNLLKESTPIDVSREDTLMEAYQGGLKDMINRMKGKSSQSDQTVSDTKSDPNKDYITEIVEESVKGGYTTSDTETVYTSAAGKTFLRLSPFIGDKQLGNFSLKSRKYQYSTAEYEVRKVYGIRGMDISQPLQFKGADGKLQSVTFEEMVAKAEQEFKKQQTYGKMVHAYFNYALETNRDRQDEAWKILEKYAKEFGVQSSPPYIRS